MLQVHGGEWPGTNNPGWCEAEASATATRDAHDTEWLQGPEKQAEGWARRATRDVRILANHTLRALSPSASASTQRQRALHPHIHLRVFMDPIY